MALWWRQKREQDLERELRSHLELEADEARASGLSAAEARHASLRAFGNPALVREDVREAWGWTFLDRLAQDAAYAWRGMTRSPAFTATAVLSLALGIGANTAIFTLIDAVILRQLPVRDPQTLVQLTMQGLAPEPVESFSYPLIRALADRREIFADLCGFAAYRFSVGQDGQLESTPGEWVTGGYYSTLGLQPQAGRLLAPADDRPGAPPVTVISDAYWQRKFARDPAAIGGQVLVEGKPVTIVGVSPAGFTGADVGATADLTLPLGVLPQIFSDRDYLVDASSWWLRVLARPRPLLSRAQVKARLAVVWRPVWESATPPNMTGARKRVARSTLDVISGATGFTDLRRQFRRPLLALMVVTGLLLLIACANVANLLLARAAGRQREMAIRLAIGAGRARILRQLLTEGLLLALLGATLGILLAWAGSRVLVDLLSSGQLHPLALDVAPDGRVLGFTAAAACATGIFFGLAPAFRATASGPGAALNQKVSAGGSRFAAVLVVAQISLALLLLIGAGLFTGTLRNLDRLDAGFHGNGVLLVDANGSREGYRGSRAKEFYERTLDKVEALPGVRSASFALITPLAGGGISQAVAVEKQPVIQQEIHFNAISRRYFETLATPVLRGREFSRQDDAGAPAVAVVNQRFARQFLPPGDPLGRRLRVGREEQEFTIVGVVRDSVYESLRLAAPPTVYVPLAQWAQPARPGVVFEVHAAGSVAQVAGNLRSLIQPLLPGSPVEVHALTQQVERALVRERLMATLASGFGVLGLVLAVVGLYGLLAYTVARRTGEIGIRMALGARRPQVAWMVVRNALALVSAGAALGAAAAALASRLVTSLLFGLTATDPLTMAAATAVLAAAAAFAALLPAWRAARVDPIEALRYE